jgi:hypothetical protein
MKTGRLTKFLVSYSYSSSSSSSSSSNQLSFQHGKLFSGRQCTATGRRTTGSAGIFLKIFFFDAARILSRRRAAEVDSKGMRRWLVDIHTNFEQLAIGKYLHGIVLLTAGSRINFAYTRPCRVSIANDVCLCY